MPCLLCVPALARGAHGGGGNSVTGAAAATVEKLARRESDPLLFHAQLRDGSGRIQSAKLRGSGRTPAVVFNQVCLRACVCCRPQPPFSTPLPACSLTRTNC